MLVGVDIGGTFTDFIIFDGKSVRSYKVLSTPQNPLLALIRGLNELNIDSNTIIYQIFNLILRMP